MDMVHFRDEKASCQEDCFRRLPDELVLFIFDIMSDLKSLFQCSLVSKRFSSIVFQVRNISVTVPGTGLYPNNGNGILHMVVREMIDSSSERILAILELLTHYNLPAFLKRFRELEFIRLEYTFPLNSASSSYPKWKVKFSSDGAKLGSFVAILPDSVNGNHTHEHEQKGLQKFRCMNCIWFSYRCYIEWLCVIYMLVRDHLKLKKVTITDSGKRGTLVMSGEQLVEMRGLRLEELSRYIRVHFCEMGTVHELNLPLSGTVMRVVRLLKLRHSEEALVENEDEDELLCEAIREIYKNHGNMIYRMV